MKTHELFEKRRTSDLAPQKHQVKIEVPPNTPGAYQEKDYFTGKMGDKWFKWVERIKKDDEGKVVMRHPFYRPGFRKGREGRGAILGTQGDWLKLMGATEADVAEARKKVLASTEYKKLMSMGFEDISTPGEVERGTIGIRLELKPKNARGTYDSDSIIKRKIHPNGNIRTFSSGNDSEHHASRGRTYHPHTIETHPDETPVERIVNSMRASMDHIAKMYLKPAFRAKMDKLSPGIS